MKTLEGEELKKVLDVDKYAESRQDYMARMESEGFKIYLPSPNEVLIDIDNEDDYEYFLIAINRFEEEFESRIPFKIIPSKSGLPHQHIICEFPFEMENLQRVAFQAVLGSDRVREMLSLFRIIQGDTYPSLLAIKPEDI